MRRRGHAPLPDEDTLVSEEAEPESRAVQASESRKLDEVIALLPDEFREVLILREMEDMSYREIAEVTGVSHRHGDVAPGAGPRR